MVEVLGPLLFFLYIKDLPKISKLLKFFLFADNTNIYFESDDATNFNKTVNKELKEIKSWIDCNKLVININKKNSVLFHSPGKKLPDLIPLKLGKKVIKRSKCVTFLSVLVDEHLSWKHHTTELCKKLSKTLGTFSNLGIGFLQKLFCAYIIHCFHPFFIMHLLLGVLLVTHILLFFFVSRRKYFDA